MRRFALIDTRKEETRTAEKLPGTIPYLCCRAARNCDHVASSSMELSISRRELLLTSGGLQPGRM
jgi:hypothetical protein